MKTLYDKLREEGISTNYQQGGNKLKCPQCQGANGSHNPKDNPLSLTVKSDSAVWLCHHCGYKGTWTQSYGVYRPYEIKKKYSRPEAQKRNVVNMATYDYFKKRGISEQTCKDFSIRYHKMWYEFPYFDDEGIASIKYRTADKRFKQTKDTKPTLYNYPKIKQAESVIFCEGEIDVLSCYEVGFDNATTLPNGAPKEAKLNDDDARFKPLEFCPLEATKIILFTDNDPSGRALHKELLHRFGKDMCWFVRLPEGCKDANDVLVKHGHAMLREIIENCEPYPVDGLHIANDYWNQIQELYDGKYEKPYEVGMDGLDPIYKIMKGTFHVVTGIPNHGKSLFLDQVLVNLATTHKMRFAIFSPEHSTSMHIRRLLQMVNKKPFDETLDNRMTKDDIATGMKFINEHFYFIEAGEAVPSIDFILKVAKSACMKYSIDGLIIDPYNEVDAKRSGNAREDEHIRDFISTCKRFAKIHDVVCWVVAHPTKLPKTDKGGYAPPTAYDISGAAHWHNQADAVLTVHRDFDENSTKVMTRKIREQDLYGKIGEAKFIYNFRTRCYEPQTSGDWDYSFD